MAAPKQASVILLGLPGAGKTTILYKYTMGDVTVVPTGGNFNVETIQHPLATLSIFDMGGEGNQWEFYYAKAEALIFVVDASDSARIDEAKETLKKVLGWKDLNVLVYATKQDKAGALSVADITAKLDLSNLTKKKWHVQAATGTTPQQGVQEGLDWVAKVVSEEN